MNPKNSKLLVYYAAPYFAYVALGALDRFLSIEWIYAIRLVVVPAILIWAWRWYKPLKGPKSPLASTAVGVGAGILGTVLWVSLIAPFVDKAPAAWETQAFYLRLAASSLVVPVFEELFMRGFVFFFVLQLYQERKKAVRSAFDVSLHELSINDISHVSWSAPAIVISTVAFTLGHQMFEWPASLVYGLLMSMLLVLRKDLLTCVVAHGTTNACLSFYVYATGSWQYW